MDDLYIARQPIYDKSLGIVGYELLYRNNSTNSSEIIDEKIASSETLVNSFIHIGIDNLVGTSRAFVNLPVDFILNAGLLPEFHEKSVLEINNDIEITDDIIAGVKKLKSNNYKIAIDGFVLNEKIKPLLELSDYVKIDVLNQQYKDIYDTVSELRKNYKCELIAEKIETQVLYEEYKKLDFDYYQGYFFCYPQMIQQKNTLANKMVVMNLISHIQTPDIDIDELEIILTQDVSLTYKLLRYINSASFSLRREIDSVKDAIVLLGLTSIKNWASLILMGQMGTDKPEQIVVTALVRAKMAELMAEAAYSGHEKQAFICGLFSVLDALMDMEMVDLLDAVILSTPIKVALLDFEGELGLILENCIDYERARFNKLASDKATIYYASYMAATKWADATIKDLQE